MVEEISVKVLDVLAHLASSCHCAINDMRQVTVGDRNFLVFCISPASLSGNSGEVIDFGTKWVAVELETLEERNPQLYVLDRTVEPIGLHVLACRRHRGLVAWLYPDLHDQLAPEKPSLSERFIHWVVDNVPNRADVHLPEPKRRKPGRWVRRGKIKTRRPSSVLEAIQRWAGSY